MITASLVLYNTPKELFDKLIASYEPSNNRRLFVVDNSPSENKYLRNNEKDGIEYFRIGKNIGYGSGHNIGIMKAIELGSDYHLVLNPDIEFDSSIINELVKYADLHKDVVYILPKVMYPNGELQCLCKLLPTPFDLIIRRFLPNKGIFKRMNDNYILASFGYNKIINPPCLSGCFMFMRTETLKKHELRFDDRFFMYCEDFDLIRRLHRYGKTIYYPTVSIIHNHAKSSYKDRKMLLEHTKSAIKYFNKYGWFFDKERSEMNKKIKNELLKNDMELGGTKAKAESQHIKTF